jgi:hypothetical protein
VNNGILQVKSEGHSSYMSGGPVKSDITTISAIGISDVQLAVLDSNTGIPDFSAIGISDVQLAVLDSNTGIPDFSAVYITQTYVSPL